MTLGSQLDGLLCVRSGHWAVHVIQFYVSWLTLSQYI